MKLQLLHHQSLWIKPAGMMHLVTDWPQFYASFIGADLCVLCTALCKMYIRFVVVLQPVKIKKFGLGALLQWPYRRFLSSISPEEVVKPWKQGWSRLTGGEDAHLYLSRFWHANKWYAHRALTDALKLYAEITTCSAKNMIKIISIVIFIIS